MHENALIDVLRQFDAKVTVHGFRSTFSDWAHEKTDHVDETIEHCLAHSVGSKVAQPYWRGSNLGKPTKLMQLWGNYCAGVAEADNVVKLHA